MNLTQTMRTGPVRGKAPGVAAIDYNGDRYCLDCAKTVIDGESLSYQKDSGEWESVESANGTGIVDGLIHGGIYTLSMGGVVLRHSLDGIDACHCGRQTHCVNALSPDKHTYDHDSPVGVKLDV